MDEMDLLRDFRSGVASDHEAARTAARQRLETAMTVHTAARPRFPVRLLRTLAAAAAVVIVILVASSLAGGKSSTISSAAAFELNRAAERAARVVSPAFAQDGEYAYYRSDVLRGFTSEDHLVPRTREIWVGNDGSGRIVESLTGEIIWFNGPDPIAEAEIGHSFPRNDIFGPGNSLAPVFQRIGLHPDEMDRLAGNERAFRSWMNGQLKGSGWPDEIKAYMLVADLLREAALPPEFVAAVYRYAATIPDVELLGPVTDNAGRAALAIAKESRGIRYELYFDPTTSALLEERELVSRDNQSGYPAPAGTLVGRTTYLEYAVVQSTSERP